ncbi:RHS repeat-associated core domain-containing protein [Ectopseudomonas khazarica]|uniref:RHS repeat-associated core domain-containing protein n=1 Tax=Ectopseudomonas khazarica TaxID=2502979 RepID=UPI004033E7E3
MTESAGLPVSHIGHEVVEAVIVTGSPNVFVGSTAVGMADQPTACAPSVGQPVNPILGAKLLPAETDFALPAPMPLVFARGYLSRNARIGALGQGWSLPGDGLELELTAAAATLIDAQGRRIGFPPLEPGSLYYSGSEQLWIRRGGGAQASWGRRWYGVPAALQHDEQSVLLLSGQGFLHFRQGAQGRWRLCAIFDRNGYRNEFEWGEHGVLSSIRDSAGRSYALIYQRLFDARAADHGLRLLGVVLANVAGPIPAGFDPAHPDNDWLVRYDFTAEGDLSQVRNRVGEVVRTFTWCEHLMTGHGQPGGLEMRYEWDQHTAQGKVLRQIEADGLSHSYHYHDDHTEVTDSLGRSQRFEFTGEGGLQRWSAHVRADGSRLEFEYDLFGRQVAVKAPLGRTSRRYLDGEGRLLEEQSPGGASQRYSLDPETGWPLGLQDSAGRQWTLTRDTRGNLLSVLDPLGGLTRYEYADPQLPDRPTRILDAKGGAKTLTWNRCGQLLSYTDCSGHTTHHEYDDQGRLVASRDPLGQRVTRHYDRLGQLTRLGLADGSHEHYAYDRLGRLLSLTDAQGRVTRLAWDRAGRLSQRLDPAGLSQACRYDPAGRLLSLSNENQAQSHFGYDLLDRLIEERGFDGRCQHYHYNAAGELIERHEADGRITRYDYDRDGRLLARHLPATERVEAFSEHFQWSPGGQLLAVQTPHSEILLRYDGAGRLALETQRHRDGWHYSLTHQYDELGQRQRSQYGDAPAVSWLTYGPGHLHGVLVGGLELAFERDGLHREINRDARLTQGGECLFSQRRDYDSLGRLRDSQLEPLTGQAWRRHYDYDPSGQLSAIHDNQLADIAYRYDLSGRLSGSRHGEHEQRYRFDPAGNRLQLDATRAAPVGDWSQRVQANLDNPDFDLLGEPQAVADDPQRIWPSNRISELHGTVYRHDAAGNLIERRRADGQVLTLAYDGAHRLSYLHRQDPDGQQLEAHYQYDGLSRRILKQVRQNGQETTTWYGWDGDRQCAEASAQRLRTTVYEPERFVPLLRLEQQRQAPDPLLEELRQLMAGEGHALPQAFCPEVEDLQLACFHTDHLGTPLRLTGERGQTLWQGEPDDWTAIGQEQGETDQPIRFQGQYHDEESGLYYNRYRYYAPELGRYVTQDPIGLAGGENFYQYPSPTTLVDPMGLEPEQTWWGKLKQTAAEWGIRPGGAQLEHRPIDPERLPPGVQSSIPVGDGIGEACNDKEIGLGGLGMVDKLLGKILGNKGGAGLGVGGDIACVDPSITAHKTAESAVNGIVEGSGAAGAGLRAIRDARERRDKEAGL